MEKDKKQRETIALVRNKLYRTYQFQGIVGKGKDSDFVFKNVICQIFLWLKDRFRQFEQTPDQILILSDISKINDLSLQQFNINDGYIIETAYIPEDKIWSFRLTEPDMGTSERNPVPGRLFVTNFALRIIDDNVELGCKTVCAQPESIEEDAEVFRPKIIRDLKDNLGLWSTMELSYEAGNLEDGKIIKKFDFLSNCSNRNMPILVIERKKAVLPGNLIEISNDYIGSVLKPSIDLKMLSNLDNPVNPRLDWTVTANELAKSLCGFAHVFRNLSGSQNRIRIFYPDGEIEDIETSEITEAEKGQLFKLMIIDKIRSYPKRNENFFYGNIVFLQEAIAMKQERDLELLKLSEDSLAEIRELYKINERLRQEKVLEEQKNRDCFIKYNDEKKNRNSDEKSYNDRLRQISGKVTKLEKENIALSDNLKAVEMDLEMYQARENRPDTAEKLIGWIEEYFYDDILLLPRASDEIKKSKNFSIDLMCDGIEVLGKAYRKWRCNQITEEQYVCQCKSLCKTPCEITQTGDASIKKYPKEYKVPYNDDIALERGGKRELDWHLKYGVDSKFLLRIYFFWDEKLEKVVIGSMPYHLRSV